MKNKNINYSLINIALIGLIIWLIVSTGKFWFAAFDKIIEIIVPFALAFSFAYVLYPFLKWLESKRVPKWLALGIIITLVIGFIILIISLLTPIVYEQIQGLISNIIKFIQDISKKYNIDLNIIQ